MKLGDARDADQPGHDDTGGLQVALRDVALARDEPGERAASCVVGERRDLLALSVVRGGLGRRTRPRLRVGLGRQAERGQARIV